MGTGKNSQCVEFETPSGQTTAGCFEIQCAPSREKYTVIFQREDEISVECTEELAGTKIQRGLYSVKCVNPNLICRNRNTKCPFDCFFRGKCRESGICSCNFFYDGDYCEKEIQFPKQLNRMLKKIKEINGF